VKLTGDGFPLSGSGYCYAKLAQHQEEAEGFPTEVRIRLCCRAGMPAAMPGGSARAKLTGEAAAKAAAAWRGVDGAAVIWVAQRNGCG
jgi:hypothetical protein